MAEDHQAVVADRILAGAVATASKRIGRPRTIEE
jgi:hypothetical protein